MKIGSTQRYRGYTIRRTHAGYSVEQPGGAHVETVATYADAIQAIERHFNNWSSRGRAA